MGYTQQNPPCANYHDRIPEPIAAALGGGRRRTSSPHSVTVALVRLTLIGIFAPSPRPTPPFVMKTARIFQQDQLAGSLEAQDSGSYRFIYEPDFRGEPVSLTMPLTQRVWEFPSFPAPFEGLLPEGVQLEALLRHRKLDRYDLFGQLLAVGQDVVGSLRIDHTP